jgi:SAM-dependent methyltransferase
MTSLRLDVPALRSFRDFMNEMMYPLLDFLMSAEVDSRLLLSGFPPFAPLQQAVRRLDAPHQALFRLFRLGETVDDAAVRGAVPAPVLDALCEAGILVREANGWRTPGLLLVPVEGLLVLVATPASYPTSTGNPHPVFDLTSYVLAKALPTSLAGLRVLDVCSGGGLQALLCAARGAARVVGLELSEHAVEVARANAVLNGMESVVEFRVSDLLGALHGSETFDFVVCNTPYVPMLLDAEPPASPDRVGSSLLLPMVESLTPHLAEGARGVLASWRSAGHRSSTYLMRSVAERLETAGYSVSAVVDRTPETVEGVLRILQGDLEQRPGARPARTAEVVRATAKLLRATDPPVDGFYNQLVSFRRGGGVRDRAISGLSLG